MEKHQEIRLYNKFKDNNLHEFLELTNFLNLPAVQIRIGDKLQQKGDKSYTVYIQNQIGLVKKI